MTSMEIHLIWGTYSNRLHQNEWDGNEWQVTYLTFGGGGGAKRNHLKQI